MSDNNLFDGLKDLMREQMKEAYMEGAHRGSVTTCAVIYQTMKADGLEEDNFLFLILKDLAHQHGCDNLAEEAEKLQNKVAPASNELLS
jgi:hypothetical protein